MTARDASAPMQIPEAPLRFGSCVVDRKRGCLFLDGSEVKLRPKTFAVLEYLAENSGRLISKDELFAVVWPNLATTDDTLVQSIGELRRALGEDGLRLIKTIPRRGYRFESEAADDAPLNDASLNVAADDVSRLSAISSNAGSSTAPTGTIALTRELRGQRSYAGDWVTRSIRRRGEPAFQ